MPLLTYVRTSLALIGFGLALVVLGIGHWHYRYLLRQIAQTRFELE